MSENPFVVIAPDVKLGKNVKFSKFINLYGCSIGDNTKIGTFVEIQKNAHVGANCKISSHTFICEGVTIEDDVFVGHNVAFINDTYPRATAEGGALQTEADWKVECTRVKRGASIGSGCTILANLSIGENAIIGAGSVVTKDVPPNTIAAGNPARVLRRIEDRGSRNEARGKKEIILMKFENLEVWQRATDLSADIYQKLKSLKDYGFKDQITRSGLSIPSNIAEGFERNSQKECISFLSYAKGSCGELRTQIHIGMRIGYVDKSDGERWLQEAEEIS